MSLPTPYYEEPGITLYHADCRDVLPHLPKVDLVLTDPPYGIGYVHGKCNGTNYTRFYGEASKVIGDDVPFDPAFLLNIGAKGLILWGANNFASRLPDSRGWLIWDKRAATVTNDHSDCELAWTNLINTARICYHIWDGFRRGPETGVDRVHPTQKPIEVMKWCLGLAADAQVILDPFCGSGTTLRAAKDLGRQAIGIEISERYCQIAVERLRQAVLPLCD